MMVSWLTPLACAHRLSRALLAAGLCWAACSSLARAEDAIPAATVPEAPAQPLPAETNDPSRVENLRITDPYIELHTGPGRGFPVFFVVARGAWIGIELRHTDWYKVRTAEGKLGWVQREQLASTLTDAGEHKTFRDVVLDDYLRRHIEAGAALGRFQAEPLVRLWLGYRVSDTLSLEGSLSQVQGVYSGTALWQMNLIVEPWIDHRLSPFLGVGLGRFNNVPNASLVNNATTDAKLGNATLGLRYHLSDRFVLRADYTLYSVFLSDLQSREYKAVTAGLSFFF